MTRTDDRNAFVMQERDRQVAYFDGAHPIRARFLGSAYRFEQTSLNLAPSISDAAFRYFDVNNITWHTHANHARSSQVCCLNFLMPLAEDHERLARLVSSALGIEKPKMQKMEDGPDGRPWFIGFEWNGGGPLPRGAARERGFSDSLDKSRTFVPIGGRLQRVPADQHGAGILRRVKPQQEICEADAGALLAPPQDSLRKRVVGPVRKIIAVGDEQGLPIRFTSCNN